MYLPRISVNNHLHKFFTHNVAPSVDDKGAVIDLYSSGVTKLEKGVAVMIDESCEQAFVHDAVWVGGFWTRKHVQGGFL